MPSGVMSARAVRTRICASCRASVRTTGHSRPPNLPQQLLSARMNLAARANRSRLSGWQFSISGIVFLQSCHHSTLPIKRDTAERKATNRAVGAPPARGLSPLTAGAVFADPTGSSAALAPDNFEGRPGTVGVWPPNDHKAHQGGQLLARKPASAPELRSLPLSSPPIECPPRIEPPGRM